MALATAAGGEGDLSHDKLSCLRTIGSGFAALIYNFPKEAGFLEMKRACKSVWEALDKNENLPIILVCSPTCLVYLLDCYVVFMRISGAV